jgi:uncharacterized cupin superfamily protein
VSVNLFEVPLQDDENPDGYHTWYAKVGPLVGAEHFGMSVYELSRGQSVCPYHYETDEEWLIVLTGHPTLRTPEGEQQLRPWDAVFFPNGEAGAHKVTNYDEQTSRVTMASINRTPSCAVYSDSNKVGVWPVDKLFRLADAVDYWDGEL